jgi:hypothetical protein
LAAEPQDKSSQAQIAAAIQDVSEKAQLLIREEIELAKAEVTTKVTSLAKGIVVAIAGGVFAIVGLLFLLHGFAWLISDEVFADGRSFWGYFVVAILLFVLGGLAGWLAAKAFKKGSPPKPQMAIDEAQRIKQTVQSAEAPPRSRT